VNLETAFGALRAPVEFFSVRSVDESTESIVIRKGVAQPFVRTSDRGAMVTVIDQGGCGYSATSDISPLGLQAALDRARDWAAVVGQRAVTRFEVPDDAARCGGYASPNNDTLPPRRTLFDLVAQVNADTLVDPLIVDSVASIEIRHVRHHYLTSHGGDIAQEFRYLFPGVAVVASDGHDTQTRSLGGDRGYCQQGGTEVLQRSGWLASGRPLAQEAIELLKAPNCPTGRRDLLLMPDQMMMQIHESIGHPLELDRILGDERNFAGTSFVSLDMFGSYCYGSPLLNITIDPEIPFQLASYAFDDDGSPARRHFLIRDGLLLSPLGGALSRRRALEEHGLALGGVANSRASNWNRPPIDRMANINLEPGTSSLAAMIANVEAGILMRTNVSWSIDDSRNKFQFGCEWGQCIENGQLKGVVKNPNYRGISANFWRNLKMVGDVGTRDVLGTPFCGKGEPSQLIRVGHASPACLFADVDVFGGDAE